MDPELFKAPKVKVDVDVSHAFTVKVPHATVDVVHTVSPELGNIIVAAIIAATFLAVCVLWRWKRW